MAWSRATLGQWVGLSCTLAAACSPPDQVISEILGSRDAKFVALVSATHLDMRPAGARVWADLDAEPPGEIWIFETDPGLRPGRYELAGDLLGGLEVRPPSVRLKPEALSEGSDPRLAYVAEAPPPSTFVRAPGCPLLDVRGVTLPQPFRANEVYDFGEDAIVYGPGRERFKTLLVRSRSGEVGEITLPPESPAWGPGTAGTTLDGTLFVYSNRRDVFVASTTASPPLSDARFVTSGEGLTVVQPGITPGGWVMADYTAAYLYGSETRTLAEFADPSPSLGISMAIDPAGQLAWVGGRNQELLMLGSGTLLATKSGLIHDLGFVRGRGLVLVPWTRGVDGASVLESGELRPFVFEPSDPFRDEPLWWVRVHPGGLTVGDDNGSLAFVSATGQVCPILRLHEPLTPARRTSPLYPAVLGSCPRHGCRWRRMVVATPTEKIFFITPVE